VLQVTCSHMQRLTGSCLAVHSVQRRLGKHGPTVCTDRRIPQWQHGMASSLSGRR
jgi:hypothetical protein